MSPTPDTPNTTAEVLAALADGELDLRECPDALSQIAADPQGAQRIAFQQQLRRSVGSAMSTSAMRCPQALRSQIEQLAQSAQPDSANATPAATAAPLQAVAVQPVATPRAAGPPTVLARIGRWAPAAVAAVLLFAAIGIVISNPAASNRAATPLLLDVSTIQTFGERHMHCAQDPSDNLHNPDRFGTGIEELPIKLTDYFHHSVDGISLDLSQVQYDYQLTGICAIPGDGAVHIVYQRHDDPDQSISLWISPTRDDLADQMQPGRVYVETAHNLDHPVIFWQDNGLTFYLVGDSLEDVQAVIDTLRPPA